MIYKDEPSVNDTSSNPARREGICLNCRKRWSEHYGWKCIESNKIYYVDQFTQFSEINPTHRFLTQSMKDSLNIKEEEKMTIRYGLQIGDRIKLNYDQDDHYICTVKYNPYRYTIIGVVIGHDDDNNPVIFLEEEKKQLCYTLSHYTNQNCYFDTRFVAQISKKCPQSENCFILANASEVSFIKIGKVRSIMSSSSSSSFVDMLKECAASSPYRVARMQMLTSGKEAVLNLLKKNLDPSMHFFAEAFLNSDAGQAVVLGMLGFGAPYLPEAMSENEHVQKLSDEFRKEAVAKGFNEVADFLGKFLLPVFKEALASLPPVSEAVQNKVAEHIGKKTRKRISTTKKREEVGEIEVEEGENIPVRTSSAAAE